MVTVSGKSYKIVAEEAFKNASNTQRIDLVKSLFRTIYPEQIIHALDYLTLEQKIIARDYLTKTLKGDGK